MSPPATDPIYIAAAILLGPDRRTLLVRKRGTVHFMQAGGKIEPGEAPAAALARELREELNLEIDTTAAIPLGRFSAPAANEPGRLVVADLFKVEVEGTVAPAAEIEEVAWVEPNAATHLLLAPLTRDHALPLSARLIGG